MTSSTERMPSRPDVDVRRSARRRRTVSAYRDGARVVVLIPARFSRAEEARWVERMVADVLAREARSRRQGPKASDAKLLARARELDAQYLGGSGRPASVRWSTSMAQRWGSCTTLDATIRISSRLRDFPTWVLDYVLMHELAHLLVPGHGPDFWELVGRYDRTERARGYLSGYSAATQRDGEPSPSEDSPEPSGSEVPAESDGSDDSDALF